MDRAAQYADPDEKKCAIVNDGENNTAKYAYSVLELLPLCTKSAVLCWKIEGWDERNQQGGNADEHP
ncbi:hypothetical protein V493_02555 [Pseudogymnoascus sp. VKM F-4281 (FW-2241)]|nr:hypothetical protein V493_02555 [Pseudogymnoascus sp. VKM F-4281 (FW-2241)]